MAAMESPMMNGPYMMGMIPQMTHHPPAAQQKPQVSANEKIEGFRPGMDAKVTKGGTPIRKLPKIRLGEAIEFVKPGLDVTVVGELSQELLDMVLWELTHIKPSMKVQEFRTTTYVELYLRWRAAHERMLVSGKIDGSYNRKVAGSQNITMNKT